MTQEKQPQGLRWLSAIYATYMWNFGGLFASLTLYLHHLSSISLRQSYGLFAAYASLLWILPLAGGYIAERIGYMRCNINGLILTIIGLIGLSLNSASLTYISLVLFLLGNGLFTPSLWCTVNQLYNAEDSRREKGFTTFYMTFNIGAMLGIFACGFLASHFGYSVAFSLNTVLLIVTFILLMLSRKHLHCAEGKTLDSKLSMSRGKQIGLLWAGMLISIPLVLVLFKYYVWNDRLLYILAAASIFGIYRLAKKQTSKYAKRRLFEFAVLCGFATVFWAIYNLEPSLLSVYIQTYVTRTMGSISIPAASFYGFECAAIILMGFVLNYFWSQMAKRNIQVSLTVKFAISLIFIGCGFAYLMFLIKFSGLHHLLALLPFLLCYILFATGELFIGPLGISMVGELAPTGSEGVMMGVWNLVMGLGASISDKLANFTIVPKALSFTSTHLIYQDFFRNLGIIAVACGIFILLLAPSLNRFVKK